MVGLEVLDAKQIHLSNEDISSIVEIECHPNVREWLYDYVYPGAKKELRDYHEFFRRLPENRQADVLVARSDGRVVGFLALWRLGTYMSHVASIGISVHPHYWGKGIATRLIGSATELARQKGIKRLEVETLSENAPMRHVVEKLGFKLECIRSGRVRKDRRYHDEAAYFLLM